MSSLHELKLEKELREGAEIKDKGRNYTPKDLDNTWRKLTTPILAIAEGLANLEDSPKAAAEWQTVFPPDAPTELATLPVDELLTLRQQLRAVWEECEALTSSSEIEIHGPAWKILMKWWTAYHLYNRRYWTVHFPTGRFLPTFLNYRALLARVCFDNQIYLGKCSNCKRYFVKPLRTSKFCKNCRAYDNAQRQRKLRARRKADQEKQIKGRAR